MRKLPLFILAAASLAGAAQAQNESNVVYDCDRACLTGFVDAYFTALLDNNAGALPQAAAARVTRNGEETPLAASFWDGADEVLYRFDIANPRLGDTGTEAIIQNADGTMTMFMVRLKVQDGAITEVETINVNEGEADRLWGPEQLLAHGDSPDMALTVRPADQESYYDLIAAAESYWRAFQTNGTDDYHPAWLLPDTDRWENGVHTTGQMPDGSLRSAAAGFDDGAFIGRNLWDRRYPVVDEERGIVLSIVRFGLQDGVESQSLATANDRLVGEFFQVKGGKIQEIHAVLYNRPDALGTGWETDWYGPGRGGWAEPACDRACLTRYIDAYYDALLANDASALPQATNARVTLNGQEVSLTDAFWDGADHVRWRFDAVNPQLGDTGTQVVVVDEAGVDSMEITRLKVADGAITEIEIIRTFEGDTDARWWGPDQLDPQPSAFLNLTIPPAQQNSYYDLIAIANGYFRAFQTNGTPDYRRPALMPDTRRFENGVQFTGTVRDGVYATAQEGFDQGRFIGRNLWDRRFPVVDVERGIVLVILRFGAKDQLGDDAASVTSIDRLVGEFFTVKSGKIQEVQAVMHDLESDDEPTGWDTEWYGPGKGGWHNMPTGQ